MSGGAVPLHWHSYDFHCSGDRVFDGTDEHDVSGSGSAAVSDVMVSLQS